jgi:hypothetical protein
MTERVSLEVDTLTIRIPMRLQRRGGRKLIMAPEGAAMPTPKPRPDETLIKALVRAHRWRRRIESGQAKSITDLAEHEGVTVAYVCRLLPLTCLAPDVVEAILDGRQPKGLRLAEVLGNGPLDCWTGVSREGNGASAVFPGKRSRQTEGRPPGGTGNDVRLHDIAIIGGARSVLPHLANRTNPLRGRRCTRGAGLGGWWP